MTRNSTYGQNNTKTTGNLRLNVINHIIFFSFHFYWDSFFLKPRFHNKNSEPTKSDDIFDLRVVLVVDNSDPIV